MWSVFLEVPMSQHYMYKFYVVIDCFTRQNRGALSSTTVSVKRPCYMHELLRMTPVQQLVGKGKKEKLRFKKKPQIRWDYTLLSIVVDGPTLKISPNKWINVLNCWQKICLSVGTFLAMLHDRMSRFGGGDNLNNFQMFHGSVMQKRLSSLEVERPVGAGHHCSCGLLGIGPRMWFCSHALVPHSLFIACSKRTKCATACCRLKW